MNTWPSTTTILADFYSKWRDEAALLRGQAVHKACHWTAIHPNLSYAGWADDTEAYIAPWIDGYRKFRREHEWIHQSHEQEFICQSERFISHPDHLGELDGKRTVLEIKTGLFPEVVRLQTAGQIIAIGDRSIRRVCLNLPGEGKYKLTPLTDSRDFNEFIICARYCWIKAEHGVNDDDEVRPR